MSSFVFWSVAFILFLAVVTLSLGVFLPTSNTVTTNGKVSGTSSGPNVTLVIIATGKYTSFLPEVLSTARKYFCASANRTFLIFTNFPENVPNADDVRVHKIKRAGFPGDSMYRFHYMLREQTFLKKQDFIFYVDADSRFVAPTDDAKLLSTTGIVATRHLHEVVGVWGDVHKGSPDTNPKSQAYISPEDVMHGYYAGGFQGGTAKAYLDAAKTIANMVDIDMRSNNVAEWHDESYWNKYLHSREPDISLSQSYVFPESCVGKTCEFHERGMPKSILPIIVALDKDHEEVRSGVKVFDSSDSSYSSNLSDSSDSSDLWDSSDSSKRWSWHAFWNSRF